MAAATTAGDTGVKVPTPLARSGFISIAMPGQASGTSFQPPIPTRSAIRKYEHITSG